MSSKNQHPQSCLEKSINCSITRRRNLRLSTISYAPRFDFVTAVVRFLLRNQSFRGTISKSLHEPDRTVWGYRSWFRCLIALTSWFPFLYSLLFYNLLFLHSLHDSQLEIKYYPMMFIFLFLCRTYKKNATSSISSAILAIFELD